MDPFGAKAVTTATIAASLLAARAVKKKSLTLGGAATGFLVGFSLVATGLRGFTLFFFYQIGSWATKYKHSVKAQMDQTIETSSIRGARQVLAVSGIAVALSFYHAFAFGAEQKWDFKDPTKRKASFVSAAILAHHAVSLGDTLASEMGMATGQPKKMVHLCWPPFRLVPPGTNGGITINGTLWSIVGGSLCSMFHLGMDSLSGILSGSSDGNLPGYIARVLLFGALSGGLGSMLDSILGATTQMTYWDEELKKVCHHNPEGKRKHVAGWIPLLSNEGVNFVSTAVTSVLGGWFLAPVIWSFPTSS